MHDIAIELVKLIPSVLWFCLAAALVVLFYRPILNELLPNLMGFILFTDTHSRRYRWIAGPIHALGHVGAAFVIALGASPWY